MRRDPNLQKQAACRAMERGRTAKIDAKLHRQILARLDRLDVSVKPEEMNVPGSTFTSLRDTNPTRYSVHVDGPWYLTFEFKGGDAHRIPSGTVPLRETKDGLCGQARSEPVPDAPGRTASRRNDPGHRAGQGRDCRSDRDLTPASLRHFE